MDPVMLIKKKKNINKIFRTKFRQILKSYKESNLMDAAEIISSPLSKIAVKNPE